MIYGISKRATGSDCVFEASEELYEIIKDVFPYDVFVNLYKGIIELYIDEQYIDHYVFGDEGVNDSLHLVQQKYDEFVKDICKRQKYHSSAIYSYCQDPSQIYIRGLEKDKNVVSGYEIAYIFDEDKFISNKIVLIDGTPVFIKKN